MTPELIQKYTTSFSRFAPIKGTLVHYRIEGEGEPLVLIHGAFSSLHTFNPWTAILKKHFKVIRFTLMGFGLTGPNIFNDYTVTSHLAYFKTLMDMLGIKEFHIAGNSLGGWLAWEFALRYPERVKKLVLINASGYLNDDAIPLPFKVAQTPFANRIIKYSVNKSLLERFLREVFVDQTKITQRLIDRYYDLFSRDGNSDAFIHLVNSKYRDNTRALKKLQATTLVMWGDEDRWIPVKYAQSFYDNIPNSQLVIYNQVGHIPMEEIPEQSAQDVIDFLQEKN